MTVDGKTHWSLVMYRQHQPLSHQIPSCPALALIPGWKLNLVQTLLIVWVSTRELNHYENTPHCELRALVHDIYISHCSWALIIGCYSSMDDQIWWVVTHSLYRYVHGIYRYKHMLQTCADICIFYLILVYSFAWNHFVTISPSCYFIESCYLCLWISNIYLFMFENINFSFI